MKRLVSLLALALSLSATPAPAAVISFDSTPGGAGGTITYDGAGGPAIGSGIGFVNVTGVDTPLNNGATFPCVSCTLNFTTGANNQEGPPGWQWNGGGSFVLTGSIPGIGINAPVDLLAGTFTQTPNTPGLAGATPTGLFIAIGVDTKDSTLASFYGLGPEFSFANTEIALGTFTVDPVTNGFTAVPNQADLVNLAQVPAPAALVLLGLGLLGLPLFWRGRTS